MDNFCKNCGNLLMKEISATGIISLVCTNDLTVYESNNENTLIDGDNMQATNSTEKFEHFLKCAAFDPTNKKIKNLCSSCGNLIVTLVRITNAETVVYICECGNMWT